MKRIVRLTESDLARIVKRILKENKENIKTIDDFIQIKKYTGLPIQPDIYKSENFIALNFLNKQKGPKFTITYTESTPNFFEMIIVTNPNTGLCEKVKKACQYIDSQGTTEKNRYSISEDNCGCQNNFNINNFDNIPNLIKSVYKILKS